jgi:hypothetical protein
VNGDLPVLLGGDPIQTVRRPHRLKVRPSLILAAALLGIIDAPVDMGSLLMPHANAASKSSNILSSL